MMFEHLYRQHSVLIIRKSLMIRPRIDSCPRLASCLLPLPTRAAPHPLWIPAATLARAPWRLFRHDSDHVDDSIRPEELKDGRVRGLAVRRWNDVDSRSIGCCRLFHHPLVHHVLEQVGVRRGEGQDSVSVVFREAEVDGILETTVEFAVEGWTSDLTLVRLETLLLVRKLNVGGSQRENEWKNDDLREGNLPLRASACRAR